MARTCELFAFCNLDTSEFRPMYKPATKHTDHTYTYDDDYRPDNGLVHCIRRDDSTRFHVADDVETGFMYITAPDSHRIGDADDIGVRLAMFRKLGTTRVINEAVEPGESDEDGPYVESVLVQSGGKGYHVTRMRANRYSVQDAALSTRYMVHVTRTGKWQLSGDHAKNIKPDRRNTLRAVAQCAAAVKGF